jgi:hypothetical protein
MHKHWSVFLLSLIAGCNSDLPSVQMGSPTTSSYAIYEAVAPELRAIVEQSWGTPAAWNVGGRTTLQLDRFVTADTAPYHVIGHLDEGWTRSLMERGFVESVCGADGTEESCIRGQTMAVHLSPVTFLTPDRGYVKVWMYRDGFGSTWDVIVARDTTGTWKVVSKQMTMIT